MNASSAAVGANAGSRDVDERLFVIAGNDTWVHLYPDTQTMLDCKDTVAAAPGPLEFFGVSGRRLGPVFGGSWLLEGLRETAEPADEAAVRARLCAVLDSVRASIELRIAQKPSAPGTLETALSRLPELGDQPLAECYELLESEFGDDAISRHRKDDGSAWHNFWCH